MSLSPSQVYHRVAVRSFTQSNPSSSTLINLILISFKQRQDFFFVKECLLGNRHRSPKRQMVPAPKTSNQATQNQEPRNLPLGISSSNSRKPNNASRLSRNITPLFQSRPIFRPPLLPVSTTRAICQLCDWGLLGPWSQVKPMSAIVAGRTHDAKIEYGLRIKWLTRRQIPFHP